MDAILRINRLVLYRPVQGGLHVLHVDKPDFLFAIDGLATNVWLAIDGRRSAREVLAAAEDGVELSDDNRKRFLNDGLKFLSQLLREDLVKTAPLLSGEQST